MISIGKLAKTFSLVFAIACWSEVGHAASIDRVSLGEIDGYVLRGAIEQGDAERFFDVANATNRHAVVFLNSPGGLVTEGLMIGSIIREKGFATSIPDEQTCASICSMIWLAGSTRYFEANSAIGFHAAYSGGVDNPQVSASANAVIGHYIGSLGLAPHVARVATSASPTDMDWMNAERLLMAGISYMSIEALGDFKTMKPRPWSSAAREMDERSTMPIDSVTERIAEQASASFKKAYTDGGIWGAEDQSRRCWKTVQRNGDAKHIRSCLIFDLLASSLDSVTSDQLGVERTAYFAAIQIPTRLIAFMKKHGYTHQQVDALLVSSLQAI
jgi:hypothetical protein|nr:hypothetical protein [Neorhizobium tomejilense]